MTTGLSGPSPLTFLMGSTRWLLLAHSTCQNNHSSSPSVLNMVLITIFFFLIATFYVVCLLIFLVLLSYKCAHSVICVSDFFVFVFKFRTLLKKRCCILKSYKFWKKIFFKNRNNNKNIEIKKQN